MNPRLMLEALSVVGEGDKMLLDQVNLSIDQGAFHLLMGPNGAGKSTLASYVAGDPSLRRSQGGLYLDGVEISSLPPEERAAKGLFVSFQQPIAIPGVRMFTFLQHSINALRLARGETKQPLPTLLTSIKEEMGRLDLPVALLQRSMNENFSGGERKRVELLQLALLKPTVAVLDEIDSGLDSDALHRLCDTIDRLRTHKNSFLIITHYPQLLGHLKPDHVHILHRGSLVASGGESLGAQIAKEGYRAWKDGDRSL